MPKSKPVPTNTRYVLTLPVPLYHEAARIASFDRRPLAEYIREALQAAVNRDTKKIPPDFRKPG